MVVELVAIIFLVLICTMKNYIHCTDMGTDADEVEYTTVGVGELRITNTSNGNGNDKRMVRCERLSWLDAHKYTFQTHAVTIFTKLCVKGRLHNYLDTSCSPLAIQVFNPSKAFKLFMIFFFFSKLDVVDIQATKRVRCHFESKT